MAGITTATAVATDNTAVTRVEFLLDGASKLTDIAGPYNYSLDTKILSNAMHTITAKAYDAAGNSSTSTVTVIVNNPDTAAPSNPSSLGATATSPTAAKLTWAASTDSGINASGVAKYNVLRNGVVIAQTAATSYTDTGLVGSTAYSYVVQAVDAANNTSGNSNVSGITTPTAPDTTPPVVPANLSATPLSPRQINLSWAASTDSGGSGLKSYNIYRNDVKLNSSPVTATTYGDATVRPATAYRYRIEAVDGAGNKSSQSSVVSLTIRRGDISGTGTRPDGKVDLQDLSYVIRKYDSTDTSGDISGPSGSDDGKVDLYDLSYLIRNYEQ